MNPSEILYYHPTDHFLQRMKERKISKDKILDVIRHGVSKIQKHKSGVIEFVKDKIKVIVDTVHETLVTVMHVYEKYAYLDELVNDLEFMVWSKMRAAEEKEINPENKLKFEDETIIKKIVMPIPNP